MSASRAEAAFAAAAAAIWLGLAAAPAAAQVGPPVRLTPPASRPAAPPAAVEPEPDRPGLPEERADPPRRSAEEIEVSSPPPIDGEGAGVLADGRGALPPTLWDGAERAAIDPLLGQLPLGSPSPAARALLVRLLASTGTPPRGRPAEAPTPSGFAALRAGKLLDLGEWALAADLARAVPRHEEDEALSRIQLDSAWLAGDPAGACAIARGRIARFADAYWQRALIACQLIGNDAARAELGLRMLREQGANDDPLFDRLAANLTGEARGAVTGARRVEPVHLALFRAARQPVPAEAVDGSSLAVARAVALSPLAGANARLRAAERAVGSGALDPEVLGNLYEAMALRPEELAAGLALAELDRGAKGRAAGYRAAKAEANPSARAAAIERVLSLARQRGSYAVMARALSGLLRELKPAPALAWFGGTAVRAWLYLGEIDEAGLWYEAAHTQAPVNAQAEAIAALAWPLLRMAGMLSADDDPAAGVQAWRQAETVRDPATMAPRATLLAALLRALDDPASGAMGALGRAAASPSPQSKPAPALDALSEGAAERRLGQTALASLVVLGPGGPGSIALAETARVVAALRAVGLGNEARAVAVEAAIAAGI